MALTAFAAVLLLEVLVGRGRAGEAGPDATPGEETKDSEPAPTVEEAATDYAGEEVCAVCHEAEAASYTSSVHARVLGDASRPPAQRGCEACHGPGANHAEAGGGRGVGNLETFAPSRAAAVRSRPCLACHGDDAALFRVRTGPHAVAGLACTECHSGHRAAAAHLLRAAPPDLCYGCHLQVRAEFALPERHRVDRGLITCGDCHEVHGGRATGLLRPAGNRQCLRCHVEFEGPYVFEHAAVFNEGCTRCHVPHGSVDRHLLIRQQVAQLCYECHTVTPAFHLQPSYRDCTRCHVAIHGSNISPLFLEQ